MRPLLAIACLALLSAMLAGCGEDPLRFPEPVPTTSTSRSQSTSASATTTGTGTTTSTSSGTGAPVGNDTNEPPVLSLTATANGTSVSFNLTASDPEGQPLNWTLSFGDGNQTNGTSLPQTVVHNYTAPGNYSANFTVSDGETSSSHEAALELGGAGGGSSALLDVTKTWTASLAGAVEFALGCESDGLDCAYFALPAEAPGREFTFDFSATAPAAVYFIDVYKSGTYDSTFILDPGVTTYTDVVPGGTTEFRTYASGGAQFSAHLLIP